MSPDLSKGRLYNSEGVFSESVVYIYCFAALIDEFVCIISRMGILLRMSASIVIN